jgi:dTDP-4-dehydrorhamnose reductase
MTILVTGGSGQLATALAQEGGGRVRRVGRPAFDFDRLDTLAAAFAGAAPSLVINTAAWTNVDAAETEPDAAMRANRDGPEALARLCAARGIPLIHVSTDYVFDGNKGEPYTELDVTRPVGTYGLTKLAGERAVLAACPRAIVLRTSWVYSAAGKNFVRTMLGAAQRLDRLRVVDDQRGCPTSARDLAVALLGVADRLQEGWREEYGGVLHAAGSGATTWHGLAELVFALAGRYGHKVPLLEAIRTADWPAPVARPADSRLDCGRLGRVFGLRLPDWRDGTRRTLEELLGNGRVAGRAAQQATG